MDIRVCRDKEYIYIGAIIEYLILKSLHVKRNLEDD